MSEGESSKWRVSRQICSSHPEQQASNECPCSLASAFTLLLLPSHATTAPLVSLPLLLLLPEDCRQINAMCPAAN